MLDFYEHLQLQQCRSIVMKSTHSRKHQRIFIHFFNISHVFKEYDFNSIIKMNIFTTAKKKKKKVPLQQNEKWNYVFTLSSAENVMEIEALLRHAFVLIELYFCFNRRMKKKWFFLIIDQTYSPKPQIIFLEIIHKGDRRQGRWDEAADSMIQQRRGLNFVLGILFPGNLHDSNRCSKAEMMRCCLTSFADPAVTSSGTPRCPQIGWGGLCFTRCLLRAHPSSWQRNTPRLPRCLFQRQCLLVS